MKKILFFILVLVITSCSKDKDEKVEQVSINLPSYFGINMKFGMSIDDARMVLSGTDMEMVVGSNNISLQAKRLIIHYIFYKGKLTEAKYYKTYLIERDSEAEILRGRIEASTNAVMNIRFDNEDAENAWSDDNMACTVSYQQDPDTILLGINVRRK